jgi:endonuclease/exonuclease/phosphatase family metal-dependent hydrolase
MDLRLLNVNVWHGLYARTWWKAERLEPAAQKERRTLALVEGIKALDPDVVTFQECFPQPRFGIRVAHALGLDHVSQVSNAGLRLFGAGYPLGVDTGEGSTILAKKGMGLRSRGRKSLSGLGWTFRHLSFQLVDKRMALAVEVQVGGKPLVVVTFHVRYEWASPADAVVAWNALRERKVVLGDLPPPLARSIQANATRRDDEIGVLASWIEQLRARGAPVVIAGDMNVDDDAPQLVDFMKRLDLRSALQVAGSTRKTWDAAANPNIAASAAVTYDDGKPKDPASLVVAYHDQLQQRPDHVFFGPELGKDALVEARVVLDEPIGGAVPSDHYGILATFRI